MNQKIGCPFRAEKKNDLRQKRIICGLKGRILLNGIKLIRFIQRNTALIL